MAWVLVLAVILIWLLARRVLARKASMTLDAIMLSMTLVLAACADSS